MENQYKTISAEEFLTLDLSQYTTVDLREPDEILVSGIPGAVNVPFSCFAKKLDGIPRDKPVLVYCRAGDFSEQIAEILADRGYDVAHVEGGYNRIRELMTSQGNAAEGDADAADSAERIFIDAKNLKCPGPIVKLADHLRGKPSGTAVRVEATEDAFFADVKAWCLRTGNRLEGISFRDGVITADITKASADGDAIAEGSEAADSSGNGSGNDKTFVVFSGDLDKTIAAFIMADGAAAMGRRVTMFFTFWGLNILRRPQRVKVKKPFSEKLLGAMMPRGTKRLGLSRMNMGGLGAKMIRGVMKRKNVSSLEELIGMARAHGVRLVACQTSMDIMGIRREELIDGVELGGVATFLGSGEDSDMSLFI